MSDGGYRFHNLPKPAGMLVIADGFKVQVKTRPNWFHLIFMCLILGWKWEEAS